MDDRSYPSAARSAYTVATHGDAALVLVLSGKNKDEDWAGEF